MWSEHRFLSSDGTPMFFRRIDAKPPVRGAVIVVHGMGEHGGRYAEFSDYLASRGFTCYLPDLRGFGKSGGKRGCIRRFEDYFADLESVWRTLLSREGEKSVFFLAHSYGGLVTANFLAAHPELPAKGMVLTSPNFGIAVPVPLWKKIIGPIGSVLFPDFTQGNGVNRATLTHDIPHLQKHAADGLIHDRISPRLYTELLSRIKALDETASNIKLPALVLQAGADKVVSREATEHFFQKLASPDKHFQVFEGLYHEILNETSRQTVYQQIGDWISRRA